MKYLVPLCLFALVAGLFLWLGGIGNTQPNLQVAEARPLKGTGWEIAPCKYTYGYWENSARVGTTIFNLSGEDCGFGLGDGNTAIIPTSGNLTYSYQVSLKGQTERIWIAKLTIENKGGIATQEVLILKIQPRTKGGD